MSIRIRWTRQQLLVAFNLYCQMPFGKLHSRNPEIIKYAKLINRTPSALAMKLTNIASLDPVITSTGRTGLKSVSATDKEMWNEMHEDWGKFAIESDQAMKSVSAEIRFDEKPSSDEPVDYAGSNKTIQSKARIGQGFFRKVVLSAYNNRCCITGLALPRLLVASHIIPWRADAENRLNPRNGLALSVLHDKAFDIGIITIDKDMTVKVSQKNSIIGDSFYNKAILSFDGKPISLPEKFQPNTDFLVYHRKNIFEHWEK